MSSLLKQRGNVWFVRVAVPRPHQKAISRTEVVRTTGETDRRIAERKKYQIIADIQNEIAALTNDDPSSVSWLERQAIGIRKAVSRGETDEEIANDLIGQMRDEHLKANSTLPEDEVPAPQLARLRTVTRVATDLTFAPLSDLIKDYLDEKRPNVQPSTIATKTRVLNEFAAWLQDDPDINEITRKVAGRYVSKVLVKNGKHPKTNTDTAAGLSAFFNWAAQRGVYDHANPWTGMTQTIGGSKRGFKKLKPCMWAREELKTVFSSIPEGPKYYLREMSAIALDTGMRQNEIAELEVSDIDLRGKIIDIGEGKTESSVRQVPVHRVILPIIKRLVKETSTTYLFPTLEPAGPDKKRGHEPSKRFGYWRDCTFPETVHVVNERGHKRSEVNFHSFRRSFINACEAAGIPEPTTKQVIGHAKSSLTYGTYSAGVDLKLLREAFGERKGLRRRARTGGHRGRVQRSRPCRRCDKDRLRLTSEFA